MVGTAVLSTLGVVIGVAAVVAILSVGEGVERMARESIGSTTPLQTVAIVPRTERYVDGHRLPNTQWPLFGVVDLDSLTQRLPSGCMISLTMEGTATVIDFESQETALSLIGLAGYVEHDDRLKHGRWLTLDESRGQDAVMVASTTLGCVLGMALGLGTATLVAAIIRAKSEAMVVVAFTWETAVLALGLALVVGLGFGLYPALRASRFSPIDAVRDL